MKALLVACLMLLPALAQARTELPIAPWDPALGEAALAALLQMEDGDELRASLEREADWAVERAAESGLTIPRPESTERLRLLVHDFNGDGRAEILIRYPFGYCGTAGCDYALLAQDNFGHWRKVCEGKVDESIDLLPGRAEGWQEFRDAGGTTSWFRHGPLASLPECFTRERRMTSFEFNGGRYDMTPAELHAIGWQDRHGHWTWLARRQGIVDDLAFATTYAAQEAAYAALLRLIQEELRRVGALRHAGRIVEGLHGDNWEMPLTTMGMVMAARAVGTPTVAAYVADRVARAPRPNRRALALPRAMRQRWLRAEGEIARFSNWPQMVRPARQR